MTADDRRATVVGAVMLAAMALAIAALLVIDDVRVHRHISVRVRFAHTGGLVEGARIQIAGRDVGYVHHIALGAGGDAVVHARVDARFRAMAPRNAEWFITSKGVFADRYLEIGPPPGGGARARPIEDGDEVRGTDPPRLDRLMALSARNLAATRALAAEVAPQLDALRAGVATTAQLVEEITARTTPLSALRTHARAAGEELHAAATAWRAARAGAGAVSALDVAAAARATIRRGRARVAGLRHRLDAAARELERVRGRIDRGRLARLDRAYREGRAALARLEATLGAAERLARLVDAGLGTLGGLLHDHELRDVAKQLQRVIKRQGWEVIGHPGNRALRQSDASADDHAASSP